MLMPMVDMVSSGCSRGHTGKASSKCSCFEIIVDHDDPGEDSVFKHNSLMVFEQDIKGTYIE